MQDVDARGALFDRAKLQDAHLERANLAPFDDYGTWHYASFADAHLEGAVLTGADLRQAHLEGAHLKGTHFEAANLDGATFSNPEALKEAVGVWQGKPQFRSESR
jgi:uncharacterized protein YjbI with pentapeptide repeats